MEDIKPIIAKNIVKLRTASGMTQIELAEKLNYSDKAVSKWERAESVPDIATLCTVAKLFGVTLDQLVSDNEVIILNSINADDNEIAHKKFRNHTVITAMSILLVWLIATLVFVIAEIASSSFTNGLFFIFAVPVSMIVWLTLNSIWFSRKRNFIIISLLMWSLLASVQLAALAGGALIWQIYFLGIPGQIIILLWSKLQYKK